MAGLVNEANFFVVIVALLIISFLLGLIVGKIFSRPDDSQTRSSRDEASALNENLKSTNPTQTDCSPKANTPQCQERSSGDPLSKYIYYW